MRQIIIAYVSALIVMVALDFCWLSLMAKPLYRPGIGHLMAAKPSLAAGVVFYLVFIAGLTYLVTLPAISQGLGYAASRGAAIGLMAYATYDLTAQAVLRDWPVGVTIADVIWGTILTAITATAAVFFTRLIG